MAPMQARCASWVLFLAALFAGCAAGCSDEESPASTNGGGSGGTEATGGVGGDGGDTGTGGGGPIQLSGVVQIATGYHHTCAVLDTGAARCWGRNHRGQLGYGHTSDIGDDETPASAGDVPVW